MDGQVGRPSERERASQTPYNLRRNRSLPCDHAAAFCRVVLARASGGREILSASFLRCRRNPNRKSFMVLAHRAPDCDIEPDADSLDHGGRWFVCPAVAGSKISTTIPLVAGCDDSLRHRRRLRQSSSMVSTAAGTDHGRFCWRCLRIYRIEDRIVARCDCYVVDIACGFVCTAALRFRATTL